jgi:hypothetical protein
MPWVRDKKTPETSRLESKIFSPNRDWSNTSCVMHIDEEKMCERTKKKTNERKRMSKLFP